MFRTLRKKEEGFTLVELMVVVMIIGILVAIAVPIYTKSQADAQKTACQANLRILDGALAQYMAGEGQPAQNLQDLEGKYIQKVPKCPAGGTYTLKTENGKPGYVECNIAGHTYR